MVILNENKMTFIHGEYDKSVVIYGEIRVKLMIQTPSNLQYVSVKDGNLIIVVFIEHLRHSCIDNSSQYSNTIVFTLTLQVC